MTLRLYDLAGADPNRRFSPYCWRIRLALAHKRLAIETIPWRFTEKAEIAPSGSKTVPVLVDGDRWIADSWTIANYLEDAYPDSPSLFGGAAARRFDLSDRVVVVTDENGQSTLSFEYPDGPVRPRPSRGSVEMKLACEGKVNQLLSAVQLCA